MGSITLKQAAAWCGGRVEERFAELSFTGANFDTRRLGAGELFVALLGARDGHDFAQAAMEKGACGVLAARPLGADIPAIYAEDTVRALQDIARGWRQSLSLRCVGVTGSVGKTTTKEMIAAVLAEKYRCHKTAENFNNGIGLPVTVLELDRDCEAAVLEMGMNHAGEISLLSAIAQPDLAVITNVGTMHIEHLGSRENILRAKLEILEGLRPGGSCLFCGDDRLLYGQTETYGALCYGFEAHNAFRATELHPWEDGTAFRITAPQGSFEIRLPLQGRHNVLNALAAAAVGLQWGVTPEQIRSALGSFRNTGMRQKIYEKNGIRIIEDCYNAGPESMEAALTVLYGSKGRKIAVLGDMLELGEFAPQAHYALGKKAAAADALFAYGPNGVHCIKGARENGLEHAYGFSDHETLAAELRSYLLPGDTLLLKGSRGMKMERVLSFLFQSGNGGR